MQESLYEFLGTILTLNTTLVAGEFPRDRRGKPNSRPHVLTTDMTIKIEEHISLFSTKATHFSSQTVIYSVAKLTVKSIHDLFTQRYSELKGKIKYDYYLPYFNENFAFWFGRLQIDVCLTKALENKLGDPHLNEN